MPASMLARAIFELDTGCRVCQGQNLAVWILAAKLPNSDLNFARGFLGGFFPPVFSKEKGPVKSTKSPRKIHPGNLVRKIPLACLQKLFLEDVGLIPALYMCKMGSISRCYRALLASIWEHCSQILVCTNIRGTQEGV